MQNTQHIITAFGLIRSDYNPANKLDSPNHVPYRYDENTGFIGIVPMHAILPENAQVIGVRHETQSRSSLIVKHRPAFLDKENSTITYAPMVRREFMLVPYGAPFEGIEGADMVYIGDYPTGVYNYSIFEILKPINYAQQPGNADTNS